MKVDRIAILDWSAANQPKLGKDSIWLGHADAPAENLPTRAAARDRLIALAEDALHRGETLLIGADFALGYPQGFARALTGRDGALAIWQALDERIEDDAWNRSNRLDIAAAINRALPGLGPFWFNPTKTDLPGLPRKGLERHGQRFADLRHTDSLAKGAQSVWKLGGPGSVGSQVLTGLPVLWQLRTAFRGRVTAFPFEPLDTQAHARIILAEVFPSLIDPVVRFATGPGAIRDAVQVTLLARALAVLNRRGELAQAFATPRIATLADEGWILRLGLGNGALLAAAREGI